MRSWSTCTEERALQASAEGITPVMGDLDDGQVLTEAVTWGDAVINCADSDHQNSVEFMLRAMEGTDKPFLHTSGTSIVGYPDEGELRDAVFTEETPFTPSPGRVMRVNINERVM